MGGMAVTDEVLSEFCSTNATFRPDDALSLTHRDWPKTHLDPNTLSADTSEEASSSASTLLDIHDANRKKIVIRPQCKLYVQKQKALGTLSCFSRAGVAQAKGTSPKAEPMPCKQTDGVPHALSVDQCTPETKRPRPTDRKSGAVPNMPRALRAAATVASGRIEKSPRPSTPRPRQVPTPDSPMGSPSAVAVTEYEFHSCLEPAECQRCALRRLAHKFCAIVAARKEMIRQREMVATLNVPMGAGEYVGGL
ncbi:hypothetical protein GGX14DRAFT_437763, partial [Mycena pura]